MHQEHEDSDEEVEYVEPIETFATRMMNGTKAESTKKCYLRRIERLSKWLIQTHPELVIEGEMVLPLPYEVLKEFLAHSSLKTNRDGSYIVPRQHNTVQYVGGYISAIKYLYEGKRIPVDSETSKIFKDFIGGYKREVAVLKENGEMKIVEGKQPMTVNGYEFLAKSALKSTTDFSLSLTVHTFLLFCWNLMARSITAGAIMYDRMTWEGDALVINIGKMKNDQEGQNLSPRHIYANPENPAICPILSLALLVFTNSYTRSGSSRLLFGEHAKDRFGEWLRKTARDNNEAILAMGLLLGSRDSFVQEGFGIVFSKSTEWSFTNKYLA